MIEKNPYTILRLASTEKNQDTIKQAFKKLAKENHPDNGGNEDVFKDINRAYQILSNLNDKEKYDQGIMDFNGRSKSKPQYNPSHDSTSTQAQAHTHTKGYAQEAYNKRSKNNSKKGSKKWRDIFGDKRKLLKGGDVSVTVYLDIKIAESGCNRIVSLPSGKKINVKIPAKAKDRQQLRLKGMGSPGQFGGDPGDAIINIYITGLPSEYLSENNDYVYVLKITIDEAILGSKIEVPSPTGKPLMITIPPMTKNGNRLRLKGLGKTTDDSLFIELKIVYDKNDKELIKVMQKYSKNRTFNPRIV